MSDPLPPEPESQPPLPPAVPPVPVPPPMPPVSSVAGTEPVAGSPEAPKAGVPDDKWAMGIHLSPLLALFFCCAPGVAILGPLIIWLIKRPESATLDAIGKRVLNFQISYAIYSVGVALASFLLSMVALNWLMIPVGLAVGIGWLVFTIMGAVKQNEGEVYQPPFVLDLIK